MKKKIISITRQKQTMATHPDLLTQNYDYTLPKELIATTPAIPADSAKLMVYDRKKDNVTHTTFNNFLEFIDPDTAIFLNDTKVIKARLFGHKQTGGKIELLINRPLDQNRISVIIRGKIKVGTKLLFSNDIYAIVVALQEDGSRIVEFFQNDKPIGFDELTVLLDNIGTLPLPPYMQKEATKEDESFYQTIFAKHAGAVAAPTASLHFTPKLFEAMRQKHSVYTLTLHIGAGTFKPVESKTITRHPMHSEYFHIPKDAAKVLAGTQEVLAIGTTVTRTIEYYARTKQRSGECDLFLHPLNPPMRVGKLLTNFHLPKSTLIMLVSAFIGRKKTLALYDEAIKQRYRFYSYGDAMLIL